MWHTALFLSIYPHYYDLNFGSLVLDLINDGFQSYFLLHGNATASYEDVVVIILV